MGHIVSNITYGLIATSCTVLFVVGSLTTILGMIGQFSGRSTAKEHWIGIAYMALGLVAVAIALHFTL